MGVCVASSECRARRNHWQSATFLVQTARGVRVFVFDSAVSSGSPTHPFQNPKPPPEPAHSGLGSRVWALKCTARGPEGYCEWHEVVVQGCTAWYACASGTD
eukprot:2158044-Rhodomonas_salina.1